MHYTENFIPLGTINRPILEEYCKAHGYLLSIRQVDQYHKYTGIEKLQHIDDILRMGDMALVLDADTLITNFFTKIESFFEEGKDLYVGEGMNMGAFICRKTPALKSMFVDCIKAAYLGINDCEQDFILANQHIYESIIKVCEHPCFNSYIPELYSHIDKPELVTEKEGRWIEGSFVLHVPSLDIQKRYEILKEYKDKITR